MEVVFTPRAACDMEDLLDYISRQANAERADDYTGRIIDYATALRCFAERGSRRVDILPGLLVIGFERRLTIAFVVTAKAVLIEDIFAGGRSMCSRAVSDAPTWRVAALDNGPAASHVAASAHS